MVKLVMDGKRTKRVKQLLYMSKYLYCCLHNKLRLTKQELALYRELALYILKHEPDKNDIVINFQGELLNK